MKTQLLSVLNKLQTMPDVDQAMVQIGLQQLEKTAGYTRDENPSEHFCVFFVPIVPSKRLVYIGHHIKANGWMPPGGHMDPGESPSKTLRREFEEELQHKLTFEVTELFNFTVVDVSDAGRECKKHLDFWYLVHLATPEDFIFDPGEFHDAGWVTYEEAIEKVMDKHKSTLIRLRDRV